MCLLQWCHVKAIQADHCFFSDGKTVLLCDAVILCVYIEAYTNLLHFEILYL